jgi:hypothetical protein
VVPDENSVIPDTFQHASYPVLQIDDAVRSHPSRKESIMISAYTLSLTNCSISANDITSVFNICKVGIIGVCFELFCVANLNKGVLIVLVHCAIFILGGVI